MRSLLGGGQHEISLHERNKVDFSQVSVYELRVNPHEVAQTNIFSRSGLRSCCH